MSPARPPWSKDKPPKMIVRGPGGTAAGRQHSLPTVPKREAIAIQERPDPPATPRPRGPKVFGVGVLDPQQAPGAPAPDGETPDHGITRQTLVEALEAGDWLALVSHTSEDECVAELIRAVAVVCNTVDPSDPQPLAFASVLREADVSWPAWIAMRETPSGRTVWAIWGAMIADRHLAEARLAVAQAQDRDGAAAGQVKLQLAKWTAERLDSQFSDQKTGNAATQLVQVVVRNELPPPRNP